MTLSRFLQRGTLLLLCLGLIACVKAAPRTAANPEVLPKLEAELAEFARWRDGIPALSGFVQVKIEAGSHRELFDAALLAKPPNLLYLQILDDLGQERARLVADGTRVLFYDAQENQYELWPQNAAALKKTLRLPLSVEELIARLLMQVPKEQVLRWEKADKESPLEVAFWGEQKNARLGFTENPLRLAVFEGLGASGKELYRVEYQIPEMRWSFRKPKIRLTLNFKTVDIEKKLPDDRFDTDPPTGASLRKTP